MRGSCRRGAGRGDAGQGAPGRPRRKFGHFLEVVRRKVGERPGDTGVPAGRSSARARGGDSPLTCAAPAPPPALSASSAPLPPAAALRAAAAAPRRRSSVGWRERSGTARPRTGGRRPAPRLPPPSAAAPRPLSAAARPPPRAPAHLREQVRPPPAGSAARPRCALGASSLAAAPGERGRCRCRLFQRCRSLLKFDTFSRRRPPPRPPSRLLNYALSEGQITAVPNRGLPKEACVSVCVRTGAHTAPAGKLHRELVPGRR